jgi:hypothetical protein
MIAGQTIILAVKIITFHPAGPLINDIDTSINNFYLSDYSLINALQL